MTDERVSLFSTTEGISARPYNSTVTMLEQAIGHIRMSQQLILRPRVNKHQAKRFLEYAIDAIELADKEIIP